MVQKGGHCQFCWNPFAGQHNAGCPKEIGTPEAMNEWQKGYDHGFDDHCLQWWELDRLSPTFRLGHRVGQAEIDSLVDVAYDDMCNRRVHEKEY